LKVSLSVAVAVDAGGVGFETTLFGRFAAIFFFDEEISFFVDLLRGLALGMAPPNFGTPFYSLCRQ
jgi:hypothetical protein